MFLEYFNLVLAIIIFIISIAAYFFYWGKTSYKHTFWGILAGAGAVFTINQTLVVMNLPAEWYTYYERMVGYVLLILAMICLIMDYRLEKPISCKEKPADTKPAEDKSAETKPAG